jgi:kinesin family member 2/24
MKIQVCVRRRPIFPKEETSGEIDCVSACNPRVRVHECKYRVDGVTKTVENYDFQFDNVFGSSKHETSLSVYEATIKPNM